MYLYNPFKKVIGLVVIVFSVVFLCILMLTIKMLGEKNRTNIMEYYPRLTDVDNVFEEISADEVLELFENRADCVIVFGFPACPWCQQLIPEVNLVAKKSMIMKVYYVDIKDMRDNLESPDHPKYLIIKEKLSDALDKEKDRLNAPTTVVLKGGNLIAYHLDTVPSHTIENGILPDMTDEQKQELRNILKELMKKIR